MIETVLIAHKDSQKEVNQEKGLKNRKSNKEHIIQHPFTLGRVRKMGFLMISPILSTCYVFFKRHGWTRCVDFDNYALSLNDFVQNLLQSLLLSFKYP